MSLQDPEINVGAELPEITTEAFGFGALGGDKKLKLLPEPWPTDQLPATSASLLAVASKRGLLAAAGPNGLILTPTKQIHELFQTGTADDNNIISDFTPAVTIETPQLRHIAFSSDEEYLVLSLENGSGLAVYRVQDALDQKDNAVQISMDGIPLRALIPNPALPLAHLFAAVLDTGKLVIVDIVKQQSFVLHQANVTSVCWSNMGKALIAGMADGSAVAYKTIDGQNSVLCNVPRPPGVNPNYATSAVYWLANSEFLLIHSPRDLSLLHEGDMTAGEVPDADIQLPDSVYHIARADKRYQTLTFHKFPQELLLPMFGEGVKRSLPPRISISRLRDWQPNVTDMLILASSHSVDIKVITHTRDKIQADQDTINEFVATDFLDDRRAVVPPEVYGETGDDSILIGDALDLSSEVEVLRPIPMDQEYEKSHGPLPAYLVLNHEGILSAWWVVHDNSIREHTTFPGISHQPGVSQDSEKQKDTNVPMSQSTMQKYAMDTPTTPNRIPFTPTPTTGTFGSPGLSTPGTNSNLFGGGKPPQASPGVNTAFGRPSGPAFGAPSQPGKPAFGAASLPGAPAMGATKSPWGSAAQPSTGSTANPFSNMSGSGFAKLGASGAGPSPLGGVGGGSSIFGKSSGATPGAGSSLFGGGSSTLGGGQKSDFSFGKPAASTSTGWGSTQTSGLGTGSTVSSFPSTQQGGSLFGGTSTPAFPSFTSSKESDETKGREATPTPQVPQDKSKNLFGGGDFKLGSTFKPDGSAKDDLPKPAAPGGGLFGNFGSALGGAMPKGPATPPIKKEDEEKKLQDISTTPASPPKAKSPTPEASPVPEDAPLPPDFTKSKPAETEEDLPPLAGSPGIKVEAEESDLNDIPSSPVEEEGDFTKFSDEDDDELSVEEQESDEGEHTEGEEEDQSEEEDEEEKAEPVPTPAKPKSGWTFQDSVANSPQIRPAAPTPPAAASTTPGTPGGLFSNLSNSKPSESPLFPPTAKAKTSLFSPPAAKEQPKSLFSQPAATGQAKGSLFSSSTTNTQSASNLFSKTAIHRPSPDLPPPRTQPTQRSPSPFRSASASTRRQSSLSSSIRQPPQAPTPEPEISDLSDDDAERIRAELDTIPEPTAELPEFISHQNYTGAVTKTGTAATIERTYRDINSMIDTVGLNAHSLRGFLAFNSERKEVTRDDLDALLNEGPDGPWFSQWSLAQVHDLSDFENVLEGELDGGRVDNVLDKLAQLKRLQRDSAKLLTRLNDIRRQIINRRDPERVEASRKAALPKELAEQQKALRSEYARLLSLLSQSEEATMLLKSKLASSHATKGKSAKVPTVDAVKKTIQRLIDMTERKNSDILILESQLRKLHLAQTDGVDGSGTPNGNGRPSTPSRSMRSSRRDRAVASIETPVTTPQTNRSRMSLSELSRVAQTPEPVDDSPAHGYGLDDDYYTPDGTPRGGEHGALRELYENGGKEMEELAEIAERRKEVVGTLAGVLKKRGVRVTKVGASRLRQ